MHGHPSQYEAIGEAMLAIAGKPLHVHDDRALSRPGIRRAAVTAIGYRPPTATITRTRASTHRSEAGEQRMSHSVQMPALGESVTEGTVTRWLKSEGDTVEVDEPLLEVSTDKVDTEIPSPYGGVLEKILVAEDETAEVGARSRDHRRRLRRRWR